MNTKHNLYQEQIIIPSYELRRYACQRYKITLLFNIYHEIYLLLSYQLVGIRNAIYINKFPPKNEIKIEPAL